VEGGSVASNLIFGPQISLSYSFLGLHHTISVFVFAKSECSCYSMVGDLKKVLFHSQLPVSNLLKLFADWLWLLMIICML